MLIGYARTSTADQVAGLEAQQHQLAATGCTKLFTEQASSVGQRDQLAAALDFVREGDALVVARLDRLARSTADLLGHSKIENTVRYLAVDIEDALALTVKAEI